MSTRTCASELVGTATISATVSTQRVRSLETVIFMAADCSATTGVPRDGHGMIRAFEILRRSSCD